MIHQFAIDIPTDLKGAIITARVDLVREYPFMGMLIMSAEYLCIDHPDISTLGAFSDVDGHNYVLFNKDYFMSLSREQRAAAMLHEILHIFLMHQGRAKERAYVHKAYNIGADYVINYMIRQLNSDMIKLSDQWLYDPRFADMSADEAYHILMAEEDQNGEKVGDKYGAAGPGTGKNGQGALDGILDMPVPNETKIQNQQKMAAAIADGEKALAKGIGTNAAGILRALGELLNPIIPWKDELAEFVSTEARNRMTYNRYSRRSTKNIIFPSMTGEHVKMIFGVDTSGSMSTKDLNDAVSELAGIMETFDSWEFNLVSCDTACNEIGVYNSEEGDSIETIDKRLIGGGGTDMAPIIRYANEFEDEQAVCIIVTDGYIPEDTCARAIDEVPVIFVVTRDGIDKLNVEGAKVLYMKHE